LFSLDDVLLVDIIEISLNNRGILTVTSPDQDGFSSIHVNDPEVKKIASFAAMTISSSRNTINLNLQKILSAETKNVGWKRLQAAILIDAGAGSLYCWIQRRESPLQSDYF
jgi:hypothetical protein